MLRFSFFAIFVGVIVVLAVAGFRGTHTEKPPIAIFRGLDMAQQPRYNPQAPSTFYSDGRAERKAVEGTVPLGYNLPGAYLQTGASNSAFTQPTAGRGKAERTDYFDTGRTAGFYGDGIPMDVSEAFIQRGRERYDIHCAACHGLAGGGNGITTLYGMQGPANFQQDRLRTMPDGQFFNTITLGKNTMAPLGHQIAVEDRWAIIAYVRALELSQKAPASLLTPEQVQQLSTAKK